MRPTNKRTRPDQTDEKKRGMNKKMRPDIFKMALIEMTYKDNHIWLFGVNENWNENDPSSPRSVSVKVAFDQHIVYKGDLTCAEIEQIRGVAKVKLIGHKNFCMYDGNKSTLMKKVYFSNSRSKYHIKNQLTSDGAGKVYNEIIDPIVHFTKETGCELFRVIHVKNRKQILGNAKSTVNDIEFFVKSDQVCAPPEDESIPTSNLRECDFDIETTSLNPQSFNPDPTADPRMRDQVITIGMSLHNVNNGNHSRRLILILNPNLQNNENNVTFMERSQKEIEDYLDEKDAWGVIEFKKERGEVHLFENEMDMVATFRQIILECDVVTGWNSILFDLHYLYRRAEVWGRTDLMEMSKFKKNGIELEHIGEEGKEKYFIKTPGLVQHDAQQSCKIQKGNLASYKLTSVSELYLNMRKKDLKWQLITPSFLEGPIGRARIADYCIWDVDLVTLLCIDRNYFTSVSALSTICSLNMSQILMRGQQLRVWRILTKHILLNNYVMNRDDLDKALINYKPLKTEKKRNDAKHNNIQSMYNCLGVKEPTRERKKKKGEAAYDGGFVIEPTSGYYKNVTVIDYMALYPSIIIAYNIGFRNIVMCPLEAKELKDAGHEIYETNNSVESYCAFVMDAEETLMSRMLRVMLSERTAVKKLKAKAKKDGNNKLAAIYDALQLAIKIVCNSFYGFCGPRDNKGYFPCLPIAVTVPYIGKTLLQRLQTYVPEKFPELSVVYGDTDSIFVKFPDELTPSEIIEKAEALADHLNQLPMHRGFLILEFETLFLTLLLSKMKCYAGGKYLGPNEPLFPYFKGICAIRRDKCEWVKKVVNNFLNALVVKPIGVDDTMDQMHADMESITETKLLDFSITCKINEQYKNENLIQCKVAKKIRERMGCHEAVKVGERIRYIIQDGTQSKKLADWGIDYEYAVENNLKPRLDWYLKRVYKPILNLTTIMGPQYVSRFKSSYKKVEGRLIRKKGNIRNIMSFFQRQQ